MRPLLLECSTIYLPNLQQTGPLFYFHTFALAYDFDQFPFILPKVWLIEINSATCPLTCPNLSLQISTTLRNNKLLHTRNSCWRHATRTNKSVYSLPRLQCRNKTMFGFVCIHHFCVCVLNSVHLCPIDFSMSDSLDVVHNIGLFKKTIEIHQACAMGTELFCCLNKGCRSRVDGVLNSFLTKCNLIQLSVNFKMEVEQIMNTHWLGPSNDLKCTSK